MRGWRGQIGHVSPTYLDDAQDWFKALPEGVNVVFATLGVEAHTTEEFQRARELVERAARGLVRLGAEAVILGGSPLAALERGEGTVGLAQRLQAETGIPITTGPDAGVLALQSLGIKKLLLVTPYKESLNQAMKDHLEEVGFKILCLKSALCPGPKEMAELAPEVPYRLTKEAFRESPEADGAYIPNPKWQTMEIIEPLETALKIPVVTTVQSCIWWGLRQLRVRETKAGYGKLLERL
jgi:maleate cis-trans isomerase